MYKNATLISVQFSYKPFCIVFYSAMKYLSACNLTCIYIHLVNNHRHRSVTNSNGLVRAKAEWEIGQWIYTCSLDISTKHFNVFCYRTFCRKSESYVDNSNKHNGCIEICQQLKNRN